jgi:hypothetical protein
MECLLKEGNVDFDIAGNVDFDIREGNVIKASLKGGGSIICSNMFYVRGEECTFQHKREGYCNLSINIIRV